MANERNYLDDLYDMIDEGDSTRYISLRSNGRRIPALKDRFCVHQLDRKTVDAQAVDIYVVGGETLPGALVSCILAGDLARFCHNDAVIQSIGANASLDDEYLPLQEELCLVQIESLWFRVIFMELMGGTAKAKVYCIDYGVLATVDVNNIREFCKRAADVPVLAMMCEVVPQQAKNEICGLESVLHVRSLRLNVQNGVHDLTWH